MTPSPAKLAPFVTLPVSDDRCFFGSIAILWRRVGRPRVRWSRPRIENCSIVSRKGTQWPFQRSWPRPSEAQQERTTVNTHAAPSGRSNVAGRGPLRSTNRSAVNISAITLAKWKHSTGQSADQQSERVRASQSAVSTYTHLATLVELRGGIQGKCSIFIRTK